MLAHAKDKNVYNALEKAELTEYLRDHQRSLRSDRLGRRPREFWSTSMRYGGVCAALRPNGLVVFTLEGAVTTALVSTTGWSCTAVTSHAQTYVERLLTFSGLQTKIVQAELRTEAGAPVAGLVVRGVKSARRPVRGHRD